MEMELKASFSQYLTDCNDSITAQQRVRWRVSGFSSQSTIFLWRARFSSAIRSNILFTFRQITTLRNTEFPHYSDTAHSLDKHTPSSGVCYPFSATNFQIFHLELSKEKSVQDRIMQTILVPFVNAPRNCSTWNTIDHSSESVLRSRSTEEKATIL